MSAFERRQELIAAVGQEALLARDLDGVLDAASRALAEALGLPIVTIVELLPDEDQLCLRAGLGWSPKWLGARVPLVAGSPVGEALAERRPLVSEDHEADGRIALAPPLREGGARSGMMVPMLVRDRALGFVGVHDVRARPYTDADISFVQAIANVVAGALERRRIEVSAEADRRRLAAVLDHAGSAIYLRDREARYVLVNREFARALGSTPEKIIGTSIDELFAPEVAAAVRLTDQQAIELGEPMEVEDLTGEGDAERTWLSIKFPWYGPGGELEGVGGVSMEITERVNAERERERLRARLRRSERMEAVGQLAGGIAHDFNNLLGVILNFSELVAAELPAESQAADDLEQIRTAARSAAALTQRLLVFTRDRSDSPSAVRASDVVADVEDLLVRTVGEDVRIETRISAGEHSGRLIRGDLQQALMNLVLNARDAMPEGGRVLISVESVEHDGRPAVRLSVEDTGTGMTPEVAARAVEPLFTTKDASRGAGLGLATVYGIVAAAGGELDIESEPGSGTAIRLYLPATDDQEGTSAAGTPHASRPGAGLRVLVAEDEPAVLEMTRRILMRAGYSVVAATGVQEGLALARHEGSGLGLVISDIVMGDGSGRELVDQLRLERPDLPVVYCSGYSEDRLDGDGTEFATFVRKPFTPRQLLDAVTQELEKRS